MPENNSERLAKIWKAGFLKIAEVVAEELPCECRETAWQGLVKNCTRCIVTIICRDVLEELQQEKQRFEHDCKEV